MTPNQEKIAEQLIGKMKENKGSINWKDFRNQHSIDVTEMPHVIKSLMELGIIETFIQDTTVVRLTEKSGWPFLSFDTQRNIAIEAKFITEQKERYDLLTKKWIYKTRFFPYIVSSIALAVSLFSYFGADEKKEILNQSGKVPKQQIPKSDTSFQADTPWKKR